MALKEIRKGENTNDLNSILLNLNNGDLIALEETVKKWGFKDNESALRFALAVIAQSEGGLVYIDSKDQKKIGLKPSQELLEEKKVENSSEE